MSEVTSAIAPGATSLSAAPATTGKIRVNGRADGTNFIFETGDIAKPTITISRDEFKTLAIASKIENDRIPAAVKRTIVALLQRESITYDDSTHEINTVQMAMGELLRELRPAFYGESTLK